MYVYINTYIHIITTVKVVALNIQVDCTWKFKSFQLEWHETDLKISLILYNLWNCLIYFDDLKQCKNICPNMPL